MKSRTALGIWTGLVYLFLFAPVLVTVTVAFNPSQFGKFPIEGFTFHWFEVLADDRTLPSALVSSLLVAALATVIALPIGTACGVALARGSGRWTDVVQGLVLVPLLVPEIVLAIGLLVAGRLVLHTGASYWLLVLGHTVLVLPFVTLVIRARAAGISRTYEEAARSLGANRSRMVANIMLPMLAPGLVAAALLAFIISFDNIGMSVFLRPGGVETVPTYILGMMRTSISPAINALALLMVVLTTLIPIVAITMTRVRHNLEPLAHSKRSRSDA